MKKILQFSFQYMLLGMTFCGCQFINSNSQTQLVDPPVISLLDGKKCSSELPPAQEDPKQINDEKKLEIYKAVKTVTNPEPQKVAKSKEIVSVPDKKEVKTPQDVVPQRTSKHENYRRGPGMWRAFNRLSTEEKKQLLSIQRSDPEKYRKILHEKADKLFEAEKIRQQELDNLVTQIKKSESEKEKENLKAVLRKKLKEDFQQRLQDTRKDIEAYKHRTARLESELQKREKNCDAIVEAILNKRLDNNL